MCAGIVLTESPIRNTYQCSSPGMPPWVLEFAGLGFPLPNDQAMQTSSSSSRSELTRYAGAPSISSGGGGMTSVFLCLSASWAGFRMEVWNKDKITAWYL